MNNDTSTDTTSAAAFGRWLKQHDACAEARAWAKGKSLTTAWATCHRADWMFWLLDAAGIALDARMNERLCCRFARAVHHLSPDPRVLACIEVREAWIRGQATDQQRAAARAAARDAARDAARAAAWDAARAAAWAAAWAAARDAARAAAWAAARAQQADWLREELPIIALEPAG